MLNAKTSWVEGFKFRVWGGLGLRVSGLGSGGRVWGLGSLFMVWSLGFGGGLELLCNFSPPLSPPFAMVRWFRSF